MSNEAEFCYKVNDFWHPNDEGGMAWNDPEIGIEWPEVQGEYKGLRKRRRLYAEGWYGTESE